ncbi:hypothetical protein [Bradyrhizobium elkanii]|uniref:hypothetical protein n=1 Tax=Bradyrhizobium elkanii TaxID=29448 RepID=UPI0008419C43|nr:hypothetical protein [Bradyrhizobium elkanii]ODM77816.1 hypothetical protein A6452_34640 [Bradyrhizobium elkanii]ODM81728.1 hypothetical protein A6X20_18875 [Bradyrhizobium elkanii]
MSWEIGSFAGIGSSAFGVFSLTEHLAFALQTLPFAFFVAVFALAMWRGTATVVGENGRALLHEFRYLAFFGWLILSAISAVSLTFWTAKLAMYNPVLERTYSVSLYMVPVLSLGPSVVFGLVLFDTSTNSARYQAGAWVLAYLCALAFSVGVTQTRFRLKYQHPSDVVTEAGVRPLIVLRANASALIGFEPATKKYVYIKGDRIRERSWVSRDELAF